MDAIELDSKEKLTLPPLDKSFSRQDKLKQMIPSPALGEKKPKWGAVTEIEKAENFTQAMFDEKKRNYTVAINYKEKQKN